VSTNALLVLEKRHRLETKELLRATATLRASTKAHPEAKERRLLDAERL
jgi:hypothetical protein